MRRGSRRNWGSATVKPWRIAIAGGASPSWSRPRGLFDDALSLCDRFQISYYDAAIVAAARILNCNVVYSEDLSDGQDYGGVKVVNPFRGL